MAEPLRRADAVELAIDGRAYGGWKEISIDLDLDAGASSFSLRVTERWQGQPDRWAIEADSPCTVSIAGVPVITGHVDRLETSLDGTSHSIDVSGRSKAGDLVDSSAIATPGSWRGRKLEQIAAELAAPFGIQVQAAGDTGPAFRLFALQQGETVWEAIQRLCSHRGLLAVSRPDGDVHIVSPKPVGTAVRLVQGLNILSLSGSHDVTGRFSSYIVKGQSAGDDELNGKPAAAAKGDASDPAVKRHRPLVIVAEDQVDGAAAKRRAEWEATVRAARAQEAQVIVLGWRRGDGALWEPGQRVELDAPAALMTAELLVAGVGFRLGESGRSAELRLVRPEAYSQLPVPEEAEASRIRKKGTARKPDEGKEAARRRYERAVAAAEKAGVL